MKTRMTVLLAVMLLMLMQFMAAATITIGSGTASNSNIPNNTNYGYSYTQQIYTQEQINSIGDILKIRFYKNAGVISNSSAWNIYMGHTTKTGFESNSDWIPVTQMSQVFSGNVSFPTTADWYEITLSTPFAYNNSDNLVIAVDENTPSYGNAVSHRVFPAGTNSVIYYRADATNPNPHATLPAASNRIATPNQIQMVFEDQLTAAINPNPANATTSPILNPYLTWERGNSSASSYDIYFGNTTPPPFVQNLTQTTYNPGTLLAGTQYYWKIVPRNATDEASDCPEWTFTTNTEAIIQIGNGNSAALNLPLNPRFLYNYSQSIYLRDDLDFANGRISKIKYYWNGQNPAPRTFNWTISMAHTTKNSFTTTTDWVPASGLTHVFQGIVTAPAAAGWIEITLHSPFIYNNIDNLVIAINDSRQSNGTTMEKFHGSNSTSTLALQLNRDASSYSSPWENSGNLVLGFANIQFTFDEIPPEAEVSISPSTLDFSLTPINTPTTSSIMVSNTGTGDLIIDSITLPEPFSASFSGTIHPGAEQQIPIQFYPSTTGIFNGVLQLNITGDYHGTDNIPVSGIGYPENFAMESFDSTTFPPGEWQQVPIIGSSQWMQNSSTFQHGSACAFLSNASESPQSTRFITPKLSIDGDNLYFYAKCGSAYVPELKVQYSSDGNQWDDLQSINLTDNWELYTIALDDLAAKAKYYLSFLGSSGTATVGNSQIFIDYVVSPPYVPRRPNPVAESYPLDDAINIPIDVTLSWIPGTGGPYGYLLYFGTSPSNVQEIADLGTDSYSFSTNLLFNSDYYWYVDPYNEYGNASDEQELAILNFKTPSGIALNPSPAHLSVNQAVTNRSLSWSNVHGASGYLIKIGTSDNASDLANMLELSTNSYTHHADWPHNSTIYWKVFTKNGAQIVAGSQWNFATSNQYTITTLPHINSLSENPASPGWTQFNSTGVSNRWNLSSTNYAGGLSPEFQCSRLGVNPGTSRLLSAPINISDVSTLIVKFRHMLDDRNTGCTLRFGYSFDAASFTTLWNMNTSSNMNHPAAEVSYTLSPSVLAGHDVVYFFWEVSGNLGAFDNWYLDNIKFLTYNTEINQVQTSSSTASLTIPAINVPFLSETAPNPDRMISQQIGFSGLTGTHLLTASSAYTPDAPLPNSGLVLSVSSSSSLNNVTLAITHNLGFIPIQVAARIGGGEYLYIHPNASWTATMAQITISTAKADNFTIVFPKDGDSTLPVTLSSFTARNTAFDYVNLNWVVESETNISGYHLYRSEAQDLALAQRINRTLIEAMANLGEVFSYNFMDHEVYAGTRYYYWLESVGLNGESEFFGPISLVVLPTGDDPVLPTIPACTQLLDAFPNPFNPATNLRYSIVEPGEIRIDIYNLKGQLIRRFDRNHSVAGYYQISWDGTDNNHKAVGSGVYFYKMTSPGYNATKKMILAK